MCRQAPTHAVSGASFTPASMPGRCSPRRYRSKQEKSSRATALLLPISRCRPSKQLAFCSEARLDQPETNLAENRFNGKQNPEDDSPLKLNRSIQSFAQAGVYSAEMKIVPQLDDDPEFVRRVELTVNGILRSHSPASLAVIKIDNWFG